MVVVSEEEEKEIAETDAYWYSDPLLGRTEPIMISD